MWDQPHFVYATQDTDCTSLMDDWKRGYPAASCMPIGIIKESALTS
jgi:hypothetical protein